MHRLRIAAACAVILLMPVSFARADDAPITRRDGFLLMWNTIKRPAEPQTKARYDDILPDDPGFTEITYAKRRNILPDEPQFAATEGYVETLFGRRRPVPEIESPIPQLRAAAERIAMNMPIQGTEADFVKMAMFEVDRDLPKISAGSRLLLQVHDELVFEVPESEVETVARAMSETMASVAKIGCPIVVEAKSGRNWADEEKLKL
jgi:hypothetical protein